MALVQAFFQPSHNKTSTISIATQTSCIKEKIHFGKLEGTIKSQIDTKNFEIPVSAEIAGELILPTDQGKNPHIEKVHQENLAWLVQMGFAKQDDVRFKKFDKAKFSALFSTPLRNNSAEDLKLVTDFISFLFIFDDVVDKRETSNVQLQDARKKEVKEVMQVFYKILSGEIRHSAKVSEVRFPAFKNFFHALLDIRNRMENLDKSYQKGFSNTFCEFFLKSLRQYFSSIEWEEKKHFKETYMCVNDYIAMRQHIGAVGLTFEFIAMVMGVNLPAEIRENPTVKRIREASINALSICNDLVSQQKELKEPEHCNMIFVVLNNLLNKIKGLAFLRGETNDNLLQQAIEETIDYHNNEIRSMLTLIKQLPQDVALKFERYYQILVGCNYDNFNWSVYLTERYKVPNIEFKCESKEDQLPKLTSITFTPNNELKLTKACKV